MKVVALACLAAGASAYQAPSTRRAFVEKTAFVAASVAVAAPAAADALEACPKGSNNCIRTSWTAPDGTSQEDAAKTVLDVLNTYPQQGQQDVDKGGWTIVSSEGSSIAVEYKSGIGTFAKFFNGGKPFVDDLKLEVDGSVVQVRSSSRVGDSDMGVNQKRLTFLAAALREKGWSVPDPKY